MSDETEGFVKILRRLRVELEKLCRELQRLDEQIKSFKEGEDR